MSRVYSPTEAQALMRKAKQAAGGSHLEKRFLARLSGAGLPAPEREYRFHPGRNWRADFAWPAQRVLVEIEGGTHTGGRHVRGYGFEKDAVKYNQAALDGWTLLRFTGRQSRSAYAIECVRAALTACESRANPAADSEPEQPQPNSGTHGEGTKTQGKG